jgi:hydrogenase expression/formation protein HypE
MKGFRVGKLPPGFLKSHVLSSLGAPSDSVVVGPAVGEDSAVLRHEGRLIAAKTDPITGAAKNIGRLVVHVNANDLAASGAQPQWLMLTQLFPAGTSMDAVAAVQRDAHEACVELGVAIVGGHTELTDSVTQPVLVGAMLGSLLTREPIRTAGARPGDRLVLTKGAGIEAMSILGHDRGEQLAHLFGSAAAAGRVAERFAAMLSVVPDARTALRAVPEGAVSSMHDPTEGGLAGALHEVADASGRGFAIDSARVLIAPEVRAVAAHYGVDALELISSGSLLLSVAPSHVAALLAALSSAAIPAADIGAVLAEPGTRTLRDEHGNVRPLRRPDQDALWACLEKRD